MDWNLKDSPKQTLARTGFKATGRKILSGTLAAVMLLGMIPMLALGNSLEFIPDADSKVYDKDAAANVVFEFNATSVSLVATDAVQLVESSTKTSLTESTDYEYGEGILSIKNDYLKDLDDGKYKFEVTFDDTEGAYDEDTVALYVYVVTVAPTDSYVVEYNISDPKDAVLDISEMGIFAGADIVTGVSEIIKDGDYEINTHGDNYSYADGKITIGDWYFEYLINNEGFGAGVEDTKELELVGVYTDEIDDGNSSELFTFTIEIEFVDNAEPGVLQTTAVYDLDRNAGEDLSFEVSLGKGTLAATAITGVERFNASGTSLGSLNSATDYELSDTAIADGKALVIKSTYLATLSEGEVILKVTFNDSSNTEATITITITQDLIPPTISGDGEFNRSAKPLEDVVFDLDLGNKATALGFTGDATFDLGSVNEKHNPDKQEGWMIEGAMVDAFAQASQFVFVLPKAAVDARGGVPGIRVIFNTNSGVWKDNTLTPNWTSASEVLSEFDFVKLVGASYHFTVELDNTLDGYSEFLNQEGKILLQIWDEPDFFAAVTAYLVIEGVSYNATGISITGTNDELRFDKDFLYDEAMQLGDPDDGGYVGDLNYLVYFDNGSLIPVTIKVTDITRGPSIVRDGDDYGYGSGGWGGFSYINKTYNMGNREGQKPYTFEIDLGEGVLSASDLTIQSFLFDDASNDPSEWSVASPTSLTLNTDYWFDAANGELVFSEDFIRTLHGANYADEAYGNDWYYTDLSYRRLLVTFDDDAATQWVITVMWIWDTEWPNSWQSQTMTLDLEKVFGDGDNVVIDMSDRFGTGMQAIKSFAELKFQFKGKEDITYTMGSDSSIIYDEDSQEIIISNEYFTALWGSDFLNDAAGERLLVFVVDAELYQGDVFGGDQFRVNIDLVDSAVKPSISTDSYLYDLVAPQNSGNIVIGFDLGTGRWEETGISDIVYGGNSLAQDMDYTVTSDTITIRKSFIESLNPQVHDTYVFEVVFDSGFSSELIVNFMESNYSFTWTAGSEQLKVTFPRGDGFRERLYAIKNDSLLTSLKPADFVQVTTTQNNGSGTGTVTVNLNSPINNGRTLYIILDPVTYADEMVDPEDSTKNLTGTEFQEKIKDLIDDGVIKVIQLSRFSSKAALETNFNYNYADGKYELGNLYKLAGADRVVAGYRNNWANTNTFTSARTFDPIDFTITEVPGSNKSWVSNANPGNRVFVRVLANEDHLNPVFASVAVELKTVAANAWSGYKVTDFVKMNGTPSWNSPYYTDYNGTYPVWQTPNDGFNYSFYLGTSNTVPALSQNHWYDENNNVPVTGKRYSINDGEPIPANLFRTMATGNNAQFRIVREADTLLGVQQARSGNFRIPAVSKRLSYPSVNNNTRTFTAAVGQEFIVVDVARWLADGAYGWFGPTSAITQSQINTANAVTRTARRYTSPVQSELQRQITQGDMPWQYIRNGGWQPVTSTTMLLDDQQNWQSWEGCYIIRRTAATESKAYSLMSWPARNTTNNTIKTNPIAPIATFDAEMIANVLQFNPSTGRLTVKKVADIPTELRWEGYTASTRINVSTNGNHFIQAPNADLRYMMNQNYDHFAEREMFEIWVQLQGNVKGSQTSVKVPIQIYADTGEIVIPEWFNQGPY